MNIYDKIIFELNEKLKLVKSASEKNKIYNEIEKIEKLKKLYN